MPPLHKTQPPGDVSPYRALKLEWQDCDRCALKEHRKNTVFLRGSVPAPILFVGEAPGESEDVIGKPFIGPAGHLLQHIITQAGIREGDYALANLVGCIPKIKTNEEIPAYKVSSPPGFAIDACKPRLKSITELVNPSLIVWVGSEAKKYGPYMVDTSEKYCVDIAHPAFIKRMHIVQQPLAIQQCIVRLGEAWEAAQEGM